MFKDYFIKLIGGLLVGFIFWITQTVNSNQNRLTKLEEWRNHAHETIEKTEEDIEELEDASGNP